MKRPGDGRSRKSPPKTSSKRAAAELADARDPADEPPSRAPAMYLPNLVEPVLRSASRDHVQGLFAVLTSAGVDGVTSAALTRLATAVVLRGHRP